MRRGLLRDNAIGLISDLLGPSTAESYRQFYQDKTDSEVTTSFKELMGEYLGHDQARKYITQLTKKTR